MLSKLFDSTDYALMIIQSCIGSLISAGMLPQSHFLLIPTGIIILRSGIAFIIAIFAIVGEYLDKQMSWRD